MDNQQLYIHLVGLPRTLRLWSRRSGSHLAVRWPAFGLVKPETIYQLLISLLYVSMILERALELFIAICRKRGGDELEGKKAGTEQQLDDAKTVLATSDQAARRAARRAIRELGPKLIEQNLAIQCYRGKTARWALLVGMTVGVLLAWLVGIRAMYPLADAGSVPDGVGGLFHGLDILITGAVIGAGSEGIHPMINSLSKHLPMRLGKRSATAVGAGFECDIGRPRARKRFCLLWRGRRSAISTARRAAYMGDAAGRIQIDAHNLKLFAYGETSQRKVRRTVRLGPPERTRTPSLEAV